MSIESNQAANSERDAIIADIHDAFGGDFLLNHGRTWTECEAADRYREPDEGKSRAEREVAWTKLVDDQHWVPFPGMGGFSFIEVKGLQYYLPIVMIRFLRGDVSEWFPGHLLQTIERWTDAWTLPYWTPAQLHAIARFISFMSRHDQDVLRNPQAENPWLISLERKWHAHLTP